MNRLPYSKVLCLLLLWCGWPPSAEGQEWQSASSLGTAGSETLERLVRDASGGLYLSGVFDGQLPFALDRLDTFGGEDVYLCRLQPNGQLDWLQTGGSQLDDAVADMVTTPNGDLIWAGDYWLRGFFADRVLEARGNAQAVFGARYGPGGALRWARSVDGSNLKELGEVSVDAAGNIFATGFFSDTLFVADTTLVARGNTDLFLLSWTGEGDLRWARNAGLTGNTRGVTLDNGPDGSTYLSGIYDDTTFLAENRLTANTFDWDVFIVRYDAAGRAVWARKAGGVLEDQVRKIRRTPGGELFLTGNLVGVMRLGADLEIRSQTGNPDFFLLRYRDDGTPLQARAMGGLLLQDPTDLLLQPERVVVGGIFRGEMTIDDMRVSTQAEVGSFVAAFAPDLSLSWINTIDGEESIFLSTLSSEGDEGVWAGGSFSGSARFGESQLDALGAFDWFFARIAETSTSAEAVAPASDISLTVYPNPVRSALFIESDAAGAFHLRLYDASGRLRLERLDTRQLRLGHLPAGFYYLEVRQGRRLWRRKLYVFP